MNVLAKLVTKNAKLIVILWTLIFAVLTFFAIQLTSKLEGDGFKYNGDYQYVSEELSKTFGLPANTIFVVFDGESDETIERTLSELKEIEDINGITSPFDEPDYKKETVAYATLDFDHTIQDFNDIIDEIREVTNKNDNTAITGGPVIAADTTVASQRDLIKAEAIGVPIALIVLLLAFGTVVASLLPVIVGAITVVSALGIMTLLSGQVDLSIFVLNIVPMLGLALSIDFALLFINRYREERASKSIEESVQIAVQTAGRSIIFSALCVMIGLGAMIVIQVEIFQNIALGGFIVVLLAVISGLTLLPALIMLLGERLNKWRLIRVKPTAGRWGVFAAFVMKNPIKIILIAVALMVIAMIPIKDMKLNIPGVDSLPTSYDSRAAYDKLVETFDFGQQATVFLLAEREEGWNDDEAKQLILDMQRDLSEHPLVLDVLTMFSAADIDSVDVWNMANSNPQAPGMLDTVAEQFIQEEQTYFVISIDAEGSTSEAQQYVRDLQDYQINGVTTYAGGVPKFNQEIFDEITAKIGIALAIIISTTFLILMIAFKSLLIPIKAIIMNIIGLGSTFGILVYVFQYGHFGLSENMIGLIIPVLVFCLVFGLSMDYEVFLISRIQEEYLNGAENTKATIEGLVSTSKIITSAALIMIVITGSFVFTDVLPVKQIGVGIAVAVAIDATIIRLMLVPSLMKLFGDWNWWLPFYKSKR